MKKAILILTITTAAASLLWAQAADEHKIIQKDRVFSQTEITIKPGEKLVFQNDDTVTHNVFSVSKTNPFNIKIQEPGKSTTVDLNEEGVTEIRCAIHPTMKLTVTVKK